MAFLWGFSVNVFIKADSVREASMQIDLFAPKESGVVSLTPKESGYLATYQHQPN